MMNYRLIAIQVGDMLKYDSTINEIDRIGGAVFNFKCEKFPNESITSSRAKLIYDWVLTLAKQKMEKSERNNLLIQFLQGITPSQHSEGVDKIMRSEKIIDTSDRKKEDASFTDRNFHSEIHKHSKKLFLEGNYFHSVFEASKAYNKEVKVKSKNQKDGSSLMLEVLSSNGVLKITACQTETEKNIQEGIKFLSAGLMQAVRNPTAHEPAVDWNISKEDCLDILSFISYLFRQLDKAVYFKARRGK